MTEKTFVVAFDFADRAADTQAFKKAIKENPDIRSWWNYIPCVYLVTSDKGADALSASLHRSSDFRRFLVMEVNPAESEGLLPERAWNWIRRRSAGTDSDAATRLAEHHSSD